MNQKLQETRKKLFSLHRNSKKKLDRRDHEIHEGKVLVRDLQHKVSVSDSQVSQQLDRLRHRAMYWKSKAKVVPDADTDFIDAAENECTKLEGEIVELEEENLDLREQVESILSESSDRIVTFRRGTITIREQYSSN